MKTTFRLPVLLLTACLIMVSVPVQLQAQSQNNNGAFVTNKGKNASATLFTSIGNYIGHFTLVKNNAGNAHFQFAGELIDGTGTPPKKPVKIAFSQTFGGAFMDFNCVINPGGRANCRAKNPK